MYAEITHEAFYRLKTDNAILLEIEQLEHAVKYYYVEHGVALLKIEQPTSQAQYFIQDINS